MSKAIELAAKLERGRTNDFSQFDIALCSAAVELRRLAGIEAENATMSELLVAANARVLRIEMDQRFPIGWIIRRADGAYDWDCAPETEPEDEDYNELKDGETFIQVYAAQPEQSEIEAERDALREQIAELEKQEPYLWHYVVNGTWDKFDRERPPSDAYDEGTLKPLYAHPTPQPWKSLTDVKWMNIVNHDTAFNGWDKDDAVNYVFKAVEAKLKEKNSTTPPAKKAVEDALKDAILSGVGMVKVMQVPVDEMFEPAEQREQLDHIEQPLTMASADELPPQHNPYDLYEHMTMELSRYYPEKKMHAAERAAAAAQAKELAELRRDAEQWRNYVREVNATSRGGVRILIEGVLPDGRLYRRCELVSSIEVTSFAGGNPFLQCADAAWHDYNNEVDAVRVAMQAQEQKQ